jgi:phage terminase large subunit
MSGVAIEAQFPEKLEFLFRPARYKVAWGGRGGAKSWNFARALLIHALQKRLRILCARELQNSIADSVHQVLADQIDLLGLGALYSIQQTTITSHNGSTFIFSGLKSNPDSLKSKEGIDILWVEEAQTVSSASWEKVIPTIRKEGSEIWVSFNPDLETDPTYQRFVVHPPPDSVVVKIGWEDNPWLPEVLRKEKDYIYSIDAEAAEHVWGGGLRKNCIAAVLRGRYVVESFEPGKDWDGPYYGGDWGYGVDPTAAVEEWVNGRALYIRREAYGVGVDLDDTPALFDVGLGPVARKHVMRADSARPETINHMRRHGYPLVIAAHKGPGSVDDGVEHLRSYEKIVIHPSCIHTAEEARLWSYKLNSAGDVLPILKDGNDNCFDAARYGLEPIIRAGKPKGQEPPKPEKRHDYDRKEPNAESWKTV